MKYFDKINSHKYLYLTDIGEPDENELRLVIEEAKVSGPPEDISVGDAVIEGTRAIESTEDCAAYEIVFNDYVGYSVLNESYVSGDDSEIFEGSCFVFTRSHTTRITFKTVHLPQPIILAHLNIMDLIALIILLTWLQCPSLVSGRLEVST